jgi:hypothetical protein
LRKLDFQILVTIPELMTVSRSNIKYRVLARVLQMHAFKDVSGQQSVLAMDCKGDVRQCRDGQ